VREKSVIEWTRINTKFEIFFLGFVGDPNIDWVNRMV
jgi:hypothetical protein